MRTGPVTHDPLVEDVLGTFAASLGRDANAYRGHVYRMLGFARALAGDLDRSPRTHDALAIAAAFHDLGIWSDATFDYLVPSASRARTWMEAHGTSASVSEVETLIALHHKLTRCPATAGPLAEVFRRADLVDLSLGLVRFGLPRALVREARAAHPNAGFHARLVDVGVRWALRHPLRPLPMMRW